MATVLPHSDDDLKQLVSQTQLKHVAIIMDGNRRWAKQHFLPAVAGHSKGVKTLKNIILSCNTWGIKYLTVYAFSTENWGRKQEEVEFLMTLIADTLKKELKQMHQDQVKISIIGDLSPLNPSMQQVFQEAMQETLENTGLNLQIAVNYGARNELKQAIKHIAQQVKEGLIQLNDITEEMIAACLYTHSLPDPDLLIRTGGEQRISNYLLWQIAYSELYISPLLWPEFDKQAFAQSIVEYAKRNRRLGKD